jgi:predicted amidohydrolase
VELHLAAVQVAWSPDLYASAETFAARMRALGEAAVAEAGARPRLVAFPELIGLPLLLTAAGDPSALCAPTFGAALTSLAPRHGGRWLRSAWRTRRLGPAAVYGCSAVAAFGIWFDTFAAVARATDAVVVAGTAFLPDVDEEPSRGWHVRDPAVHNAALVFAPGGRLLARVAKVHLTPGAEQHAGLRRGSLDALHPVVTPLGRVAVAVCLDGFHERVLATLDGRGTQVVVQPSANDAPWDRRWPADGRRSEGEAWLGEGLRARLQGRLSLRYGVNPMLVGDAFGLRPRGRSSIVANVADEGWRPGDGAASQWPGLLALAPDAEREHIVTACVPHPDQVAARGAATRARD